MQQTEKKEETKQVRIAASLHRFLKALAAKNGQKMTALINNLLATVLRDEGYGK
jgi:hypothetical protein